MEKSTTSNARERGSGSISSADLAAEKSSKDQIVAQVLSSPTSTVSKDVLDVSEPKPTSLQANPQDHSQFDRLPGLQPWRRAFILVSLFIGIFLSLMDSSIMATAVYTIALDFDSLAKAFWAILSYQLATIGFAVIVARSSDSIGRRAAVLSAFTAFVGFSLACGWARNINQLIVFRTLQGVGAAGLFSLAIILLVETSTTKLMPFVSSLIGGTVAMSGVVGPILGGVLTEYASWRWIFWINGPCGLVAVILFAVGWPLKTTAYDSSRRKLREFDFVGALLVLSASVLVVFALQEAGSGEYSWDSALVLGTLIAGCSCWILLFAWEYYIHLKYKDSIAGMIPFTLVTNRPLFAGIVSTMLTGFSYVLIVVALPLRFQIVNLRNPASAGIHLLPLLCASGVGSIVSGTINRKKNFIPHTFIIAGSLILLSVGLFSTLGSGTAIEAKEYGFQILMGFGTGMTFAAVSIMSATYTDRRTHSAAQGISSQIRIFGGAIGIAASNAIFSKTCKERLVGILTVDEIQSLQTNTRIVIALPPAAQDAVRLAYAASFRSTLRVCVYVAAAGLVLSALTWSKNLPSPQAQVMAAQARARAEGARAQAQTQASEKDVTAKV